MHKLRLILFLYLGVDIRPALLALILPLALFALPEFGISTWVVIPSVIITWLVTVKLVDTARVSRRRSGIQPPPCVRTISILRFLFPKRVCTRVFDPTLADIHIEYFEALSRKETGRANWIRWRGVGLLIFAAAAQLSVSGLSLAVKLWKAAN